MPHKGTQLVGRDGAFEFYEDRAGSAAILIKPLWGSKAGGRIALVPGYGTETQMLARTDLAIRKNIGMMWITPQGAEYVLSESPVDGVTPYWKPRGGRQNLYRRCGSLSSPIASLTLAAATGSFALPAFGSGTGAIQIPAGLLAAGVSQLHVYGEIRRTTASGTANINLRLGTANSTADNTFAVAATTATADRQWEPDSQILIGGATTYTMQNDLPRNGQSTSSSVDRTTNFNVASINYINADVSAGTVGDVFQIISLSVDILG